MLVLERAAEDQIDESWLMTVEELDQFENGFDELEG
jgi:hypothetical protein